MLFLEYKLKVNSETLHLIMHSLNVFLLNSLQLGTNKLTFIFSAKSFPKNPFTNQPHNNSHVTFSQLSRSPRNRIVSTNSAIGILLASA